MPGESETQFSSAGGGLACAMLHASSFRLQSLLIYEASGFRQIWAA
jgi:hypothetical protein